MALLDQRQEPPKPPHPPFHSGWTSADIETVLFCALRNSPLPLSHSINRLDSSYRAADLTWSLTHHSIEWCSSTASAAAPLLQSKPANLASTRFRTLVTTISCVTGQGLPLLSAGLGHRRGHEFALANPSTSRPRLC
jgi:hypothetical protein